MKVLIAMNDKRIILQSETCNKHNIPHFESRMDLTQAVELRDQLTEAIDEICKKDVPHKILDFKAPRNW